MLGHAGIPRWVRWAGRTLAWWQRCTAGSLVWPVLASHPDPFGVTRKGAAGIVLSTAWSRVWSPEMGLGGDRWAALFPPRRTCTT